MHHIINKKVALFYSLLTGKRSVLRSLSVLPRWHLVRHHDLVIGIGHEQPEGLLQNTLDEIFPFCLRRDLQLGLAPIGASVTSGFGFGFGLVVVF